MRQIITTFLILILAYSLKSQENLILSLDFDGKDDFNSQVEVPLIDNYQLEKGLSGKALNLSASSTYRYPIEIKENKLLDPNTSFTVLIWVKMKTGRQSENIIMANKRLPNNRGWMLKSNSYGSWEWNVSDGYNHYVYTSKSNRLPIDNNKWHQIGFSIDYNANEVRLFYDGQCYAVYAVNMLGDIQGTNIWIGGFGFNETYSFPGWIDNVKIWNDVVPESEVYRQYSTFIPQKVEEEEGIENLNILTFNIQNGGTETGKEIGVERVTDVIRRVDPDVAILQESFESANNIADELNYYLCRLSDELSILSRYKFGESYKTSDPHIGAAIRINPNSLQSAIICGVNLNHLPDVSHLMSSRSNHNEVIEIEKTSRNREITDILKQIELLTENADSIPVIIAGTINSGSHLDWIDATKGVHNEQVMSWPTTRTIANYGYVDSYRELNPDPTQQKGITHVNTPTNIPDRTDYIFYKGKKLDPSESVIIDTHPVKWPSDHYAVTTLFDIEVPEALNIKMNMLDLLEGDDFEAFITAYFTGDTTYKDFSSSRVWQKTDFSTKKDTTVLVLSDAKNGSFSNPVSGKITSRYGMRRWRMHYGTDIDLNTGDSIASAFAGKVRIASNQQGYGYTVVIRHMNGLETLYGHMSRLLVKEGDVVASGQIIGLGGNTGRSRGSHLHFETRYMATAFNPEKIIDFESGSLKSDTLLVTKELFGYGEKQHVTTKPKSKSAVYYTVKKGNTLSYISRKYGTTVSNLCRLNKITAKTKLQVGRKLRVK